MNINNKKFVVDVLIGNRSKIRSGIEDAINALKSEDDIRIESTMACLKKIICDMTAILETATEILYKEDNSGNR